MKIIVLLFLLFVPQSPVAYWHDKTTGAERVSAIRERLKKATPCPWKSDGHVEGWWGGEQPGVAVRSASNFQCSEFRGKNCIAGTEGGPIAQVSSAYWTGSKNPTADA